MAIWNWEAMKSITDYWKHTATINVKQKGGQRDADLLNAQLYIRDMFAHLRLAKEISKVFKAPQPAAGESRKSASTSLRNAQIL